MKTVQPVGQMPLRELEIEKHSLIQLYKEGTMTSEQANRLREVECAIKNINGAVPIFYSDGRYYSQPQPE